MKYLLDTNTCIYIIKKKPPEIKDWVTPPPTEGNTTH
jgi:predicted nucleic acid-binding protein